MAPFCLPKSSKILPKIDPKMHQIFDRFLHRFFVHFSSNLGPKLGPCWPLFRSKWSDSVEFRPLFCCVAFLNRCFLNFWSQGPMGYPIFGPQVRWGPPFLFDFWTQFDTNLAPSWRHFGARGGPGWAGGVTRSAKNLHSTLWSPPQAMCHRMWSPL